jgi:hypothetical protein
MKLGSYTRKDHVRMNVQNIWWINDRIKKGKIHPTYDDTSHLSYDNINTLLMSFLNTAGGIPYRIGAKERVDATWEMNFPEHIKVALDFLNDKVKFNGIELMDYDDAGIFESVNLEIWITPPTSNFDYKKVR